MPALRPITTPAELSDSERLLLMESALIQTNEKLDEVCTDVGEIKKNGATKEDIKAITEQFVSKDRFITVERVVYGGVGAALLAVLYALLHLVGLKF